jgi:hypothetical protein
VTEVETRLIQLAARQHQVFSRAQARAAGLSAPALSRRQFIVIVRRAALPEPAKTHGLTRTAHLIENPASHHHATDNVPSFHT